jgi:hypothetical protein
MRHNISRMVVATAAVCIGLTVVSALWGGWLFGSREKEARVNEKRQFQTVLRELAPTEAERAAISILRRESLAAYAPERFAAVESESVDIVPDSQVAVEMRFLSIDEELFATMLTTSEMTWSTIAVGAALDSGSVAFSMFSSIASPVPACVRFLSAENQEKFLNAMMLQQSSKVLQAPKVTLFSGQDVEVQDKTQTPFVTGVLPVEDGDNVTHHPYINVVEEGMWFRFQVSQLTDGSVRLDRCGFRVSKIEEVSTCDISGSCRRTVTDKGEVVEMPVTIQIPQVASSHVTLSEVTVPEGMSMLVAFPSELMAKMPFAGQHHRVAILVTPQKIVVDDSFEHITTYEQNDDGASRYVL